MFECEKLRFLMTVWIYISVLVNIPKGVDTAADRSKDFLEVRIHFN